MEIDKDHPAIKRGKEMTLSGATSSKVPDLSQIPYLALCRLARRYELGEVKHGRDNWKKGLGNKDYLINRINHVIHHAYKMIAVLQGDIEDDTDDNAGAIFWGGAFICEWMEQQERKGVSETSNSVPPMQGNVIGPPKAYKEK